MAQRPPSRALAVLLSLLMPGAGHRWLGHPRRGMAWLGAYVLAVLLVPLALFSSSARLSSWSIWFALTVGIGALFGSALDCLRLGTTKELPHWQRIALGGLSALALLVVQVLLRSSVEAFKIPSGSMMPTLLVGDQIWVDKIHRLPRRGRLVVFHDIARDVDFIKRVVAVQGDVIALHGGAIVVNGRPAVLTPLSDESYDELEDDRWRARSYRVAEERDGGETRRVLFLSGPHEFPDASCPARTRPAVGGCAIEDGHFFVVGDNRDASHDSRFFGAVPNENEKGEAFAIWYSRGRAGVRFERIGLPLR